MFLRQLAAGAPPIDSSSIPDPFTPVDGTWNITGALAVSGGISTTSGDLSTTDGILNLTIDDAVTNTFTDVITATHTSTGSTVAGYVLQ